MTITKVATADGTTLHVVAEGKKDAPAVMLSHALGGTLSQWDAIMPALIDQFRVIRYDSRGHGQSDAPPGPYSNDMLGRDALAILDALDLARSAFIGLSMGGMTAMWLGIHVPERVSALVLANTTPFIPNKAIWDENIARAQTQGIATIAPPTMDRWFGATYKAANPDGLALHTRTMADMAVAGYIGSCAALRDVDLRAQLAMIAAPTLVIGGEEDLPQSADGARMMAAAVRNGEVAFIPKAGHLSPIENPPAFSTTACAFLQRVALS
jgi:3-oxoadipate enol-lactonase